MSISSTNSLCRRSRFVWSDFFVSSKEAVSGRLVHQTVISGNFHIKGINFIDISNQGKGGAICGDSSKYKCFLIERSSFIGCSSILNGGAVFIGDPSELVILMVCGVSCSINEAGSYNGIFCSSFSNDSATAINSIILCSCLFCGQTGKGTAIIYLNNGNQTAKSINVSNAQCYNSNGIYLNNPSSIIDDVSYNSFSNSKSSNDLCLRFGGGESRNYAVHHMNIIANICENSASSLIQFTTITKMSFCSMVENHIFDIFRQNSGLMTVDRCYISPGQGNIGSVTILNEVLILSTNIMTHLSLGSCQASMFNNDHILSCRCIDFKLYNFPKYLSLFIGLQISKLLLASNW